MLTDPLLEAHVAAGTLRLYEPPKGVVVRRQRTLLLSQEAHDELYREPWDLRGDETARDAHERKRQKHAVLSRFLNGDILIQNVHVKVLKPTTATFRDLVEFRSGPPKPQSRLFTYIYRPGTWVGCSLAFRDDLGDLGDPRWEAVAQLSLDIWTKLFPGRAPYPAPHPCDTKPKMKALLDD